LADSRAGRVGAEQTQTLDSERGHRNGHARRLRKLVEDPVVSGPAVSSSVQLAADVLPVTGSEPAFAGDVLKARSDGNPEVAAVLVPAKGSCATGGDHPQPVVAEMTSVATHRRRLRPLINDSAFPSTDTCTKARETDRSIANGETLAKAASSAVTAAASSDASSPLRYDAKCAQLLQGTTVTIGGPSVSSLQVAVAPHSESAGAAIQKHDESAPPASCAEVADAGQGADAGGGGILEQRMQGLAACQPRLVPRDQHQRLQQQRQQQQQQRPRYQDGIVESSSRRALHVDSMSDGDAAAGPPHHSSACQAMLQYAAADRGLARLKRPAGALQSPKKKRVVRQLVGKAGGVACGSCGTIPHDAFDMYCYACGSELTASEMTVMLRP